MGKGFIDGVVGEQPRAPDDRLVKDIELTDKLVSYKRACLKTYDSMLIVIATTF
jgi:hypothetical protein